MKVMHIQNCEVAEMNHFFVLGSRLTPCRLSDG